MVDVLSSPPWTMSVPLSRKRSRLATDEDDEQEQFRREPSPAPILSPASDVLKRSKTQCELDELDIISPEDAWTIDIDALLQSNRIARSRADLEAHDNWARYRRRESIIVLCVQGNVQTHYDLLWYVYLYSRQDKCSCSQFDPSGTLHAVTLTSSFYPLPRPANS